MVWNGSRYPGHDGVKLAPADAWQSAAIGAAAGFGLLVIGLRPTGFAPFDIVLLTSLAAFCTWCAWSAPYWALIGCAVVATLLNAVSGSGTGLVTSIIGLTAAGWVAWRWRSSMYARAAVVAVLIVSFAEVGNLIRFGWSSAVGVLCLGCLAVGGLLFRSGDERRLALKVVGVALVVASSALIVASFSLYQARASLLEANEAAIQGLGAMQRADFETAADRFGDAADQFDLSHKRLTAPWVQPIRLVPIAAQNWSSAEQVTVTARDASLVVSSGSRSVNLGALVIENGQIDLAAIAELRLPLLEVRTALANLDNAAQDSQSPWLVPGLSARLNQLSADIARQQRLGENAVRAVEIAPALLGSSTPRHYFVMFTTPAEARGQGGFMGNFAEITISGGALTIERLGRTTDLNQSLRHPVRLDYAPADWMETWGRYGFDLPPDHHVANDVWSIVNMSSYFPNTARVIAELYPKSGGQTIDGVFSVDVYGIEAIVGLLGQVQVDGSPSLTGANTADYLLLDQYLTVADEDIDLYNAQRIDMLGAIANELIAQLMSANAPGPFELGRSLAPLAREGRVLAWSRHPAEQALFASVGIDGPLPEVPADDRGDATSPLPGPATLVVATNNSAGNKIDSFLTIDTTVSEDSIAVSFTNEAPSSGLPSFVVGSVGNRLPQGTNRMLVSLYCDDPLDEVMIDGEPTTLTQRFEAGRSLYLFSLQLAPGSSKEVVVPLPSRGLSVVLPPLRRRDIVGNGAE